MTQPQPLIDEASVTNQAQTALEQHNAQQAQTILTAFIRAQRRNVGGKVWWLMAQAVDDEQQRADCLARAHADGYTPPATSISLLKVILMRLFNMCMLMYVLYMGDKYGFKSFIYLASLGIGLLLGFILSIIDLYKDRFKRSWWGILLMSVWGLTIWFGVELVAGQFWQTLSIFQMLVGWAIYCCYLLYRNVPS